MSPAELDDLLIQHPEIKDAGVIGIPDARCGEVPLAFVVRQPNSNISEEVILKFVEGALLYIYSVILEVLHF